MNVLSKVSLKHILYSMYNSNRWSLRVVSESWVQKLTLDCTSIPWETEHTWVQGLRVLLHTIGFGATNIKFVPFVSIYVKQNFVGQLNEPQSNSKKEPTIEIRTTCRNRTPDNLRRDTCVPSTQSVCKRVLNICLEPRDRDTERGNSIRQEWRVTHTIKGHRTNNSGSSNTRKLTSKTVERTASIWTKVSSLASFLLHRSPQGEKVPS